MGRPQHFWMPLLVLRFPLESSLPFADYLANSNASTHGSFLTSRRSDELIANTRTVMADFFNCARSEVVFGPNMTTLTFALSRAIGRELCEGDEILLTTLDHDANFSP
jgi:selenocysteine lyase/cysteine desulfurase